MIDANRFLDRDEINQCLAYADKRAETSKNFEVNRVIFRLSCCCGLRCCEISGLDCGDVIVDGKKPLLRLRKEIVKGKKNGRAVPLWWDRETFEVIRDWLVIRQGEGAGKRDPFIAARRSDLRGGRLRENKIADRWQTVLKCLPDGRRSQLSIHKGRHSFATHALAQGRSLVEVQRALGHSNVAVTSEYLHLIDRDDVPDIFSRDEHGHRGTNPATDGT